MNYKDLRRKAKSGDILLFEGRSFVSRFIRAVTGQNFSHVAILVWVSDGLMVAEMKEGIGFRMMAASQWVREAEGFIYYGLAPEPVSEFREKAGQVAVRLRGESYGYLSLINVWVAQFTGKNRQADSEGDQLVCSTAVQKVWRACGYRFDQTPDPGDFARLCVYISKIEV